MKLLSVIFLVLSLYFIGTPTLHAGTKNVTNLNPSGPGSLSDEITNASDGDTIDLTQANPGTGGTILLTSPLILDKNLTLFTDTSNPITLTSVSQINLLQVEAGNSVSVTNIRFTGVDFGTGSGACIDVNGTLALDGVEIDNCRSQKGSAIYLGSSAGELNITDSYIHDNNTTMTSALPAGAIFSDSDAAINISNTAFINNKTESNGKGGAIATTTDNTVNVQNSTFAKNQAYEGSAVYSSGTYFTLNSDFLTFTENNSTSGTTGPFPSILTSQTINVKNTISVNNYPNDCSGFINSSGYNYIENNTTCEFTGTGDIINQPLSMFEIYNTSTELIAYKPHPGSAAIGGANSSECTSNGVDQIGTTRTSICDIGAIEVGEIPFGQISPTFSNLGTVINTSPQSTTFTIENNGTSSSSLSLGIKVLELISGSASDISLSDSCSGQSLAKGSTCTITATADPQTSGSKSFKIGMPLLNDSINDELNVSIEYTGVVPQTITVSSLSDSGDGSLRQAIADANNSDIIDITATGEIQLDSQIDIDKNLTIFGPGFEETNISGQGSTRIFKIVAGNNVSISGMKLRNGVPSGDGGCIFNEGNLFLEDLDIDGCSAYKGGGIYSYSDSFTNLDIKRSIIQNNTASSEDGGGIYIKDGNLTIENSSIINNTAASGGGGIYLTEPSATSLSRVINTTISGNSASIGGGLFANNGAGTDISFSTIANNTASGDNGGIKRSGDTTLRLKATILADNSGGAKPNCSSFTSEGYNIVSDTTNCDFSNSTDLNNTDPLLLELDDILSPTPIHILERTSPAIDRIPTASCTTIAGEPVSSDQRGFKRNVGDCDVGAYEFGSTELDPSASGIEIYEYTLASGWNMISLPISTDMNTTEINTTFFQSNAYITDMYTYNAYMGQFYPNLAYRYFSDDLNRNTTSPYLSEIDSSDGIWVYSDTAFTFVLGSSTRDMVLSDNIACTDHAEPLLYDWHFVGSHTDTTPEEMASCLDSVSTTKKTRLIMYYDAPSEEWLIHAPDSTLDSSIDSSVKRIEDQTSRSGNILRTDGFWVKSE